MHIKNGVRARLLKSDKFKTNIVGVFFSTQLSEDNVTTIVITMLVSDKGGMSFTYEKIVNEDGTFTYTYKASQII